MTTKKSTTQAKGKNKKLSGTDKGQKGQLGQNWKRSLGQTALHLVCLTGGGAAGAAIGNSSLLIGLPLLFMGIHKDKSYLSTAAMGMIVSNGYRKNTTTAASASVEGLQDLNPATVLKKAQERTTGFIQNMGEKLFLPIQEKWPGQSNENKPGQVDGLHEGQPVYFISPFSPEPAYSSSGERTYEVLSLADEAPDNL